MPWNMQEANRATEGINPFTNLPLKGSIHDIGSNLKSCPLKATEKILQCQTAVVWRISPDRAPETLHHPGCTQDMVKMLVREYKQLWIKTFLPGPFSHTLRGIHGNPSPWSLESITVRGQGTSLKAAHIRLSINFRHYRDLK